MPIDKLQPPDNFSSLYSYPLQAGPGKYIIYMGYTREQCKTFARKYRTYLNSLRKYPLHPLLTKLKAYSVRTEIEQVRADIFNLKVVVKDKLHIPEV